MIHRHLNIYEDKMRLLLRDSYNLSVEIDNLPHFTITTCLTYELLISTLYYFHSLLLNLTKKMLLSLNEF